MPAGTLNFNAAQISANYGWGWVGGAIPGAGARQTLFTDGTLDVTANPNAKHLGHTVEGWTMTAKAPSEDINVDEQAAPIDTSISNLEVALAASLAQTQDISGVLQYLAQGFGTYSTAAGYEQLQGGIIPIVFTPFTLIFPTKNDTTKFMVYNLYRSKNDEGLANQIKRRGAGNSPIAFRGYAITSRAATDSTFNFWKQI